MWTAQESRLPAYRIRFQCAGRLSADQHLLHEVPTAVEHAAEAWLADPTKSGGMFGVASQLAMAGRTALVS